ncbi:hypothetical protein U1Q18_028895, partial [Sarracenia purpurea var. burkii]
NLNVSISVAFRGNSGVSGPVGAVVVDGELVADPGEPPVLVGVEILEILLVPPPLALSGAELSLHGGLAAIDGEALVGGDEGSLGPVGLLQSTPRCPVVRVPQA